jgi:hypothetical protein
MSDLFSDGGDGILQFQDGTPALTSAQWSELDAALAKAPHPAPGSPPASSPPSPSASSPTSASTPAGGGGGTCPAAVPRAVGQATGAEKEPALLRAGNARLPETAGSEQ